MDSLKIKFIYFVLSMFLCITFIITGVYCATNCQFEINGSVIYTAPAHTSFTVTITSSGNTSLSEMDLVGLAVNEDSTYYRICDCYEKSTQTDCIIIGNLSYISFIVVRYVANLPSTTIPSDVNIKAGSGEIPLTIYYNNTSMTILADGLTGSPGQFGFEVTKNMDIQLKFGY